MTEQSYRKKCHCGARSAVAIPSFDKIQKNLLIEVYKSGLIMAIGMKKEMHLKMN